MKWIKTSDRLPTIKHKYHVKSRVGKYDDLVVFEPGYCEKEFINQYEYWLDESEEEITDTQRLDWLASEDNILYLLDNHDRALTKESLREFIDKQIKEQ